MFKPTREQILQAWQDRDEGKPLSKDMALYLDQLEQQEQANAQAKQESKQAVKAALRAELRAMEPELRSAISRARIAVAGSSSVLIEGELDAQLKRYWELMHRIDRM